MFFETIVVKNEPETMSTEFKGKKSEDGTIFYNSFILLYILCQEYYIHLLIYPS